VSELAAALAADLVHGYRVWAARLGVPIGRCEVDVRCEDDRGQRLTIDVVVSGRITEADARRVVDAADRCSLALANVPPAVERVHRLTITNGNENQNANANERNEP
jgi:hypothetical protein